VRPDSFCQGNDHVLHDRPKNQLDDHSVFFRSANTCSEVRAAWLVVTDDRSLRKRKETTIMALKAGDKAPDFRLPVDGGADITLASFRGRKLVLYAYPKDDTSGCTAEAIDFNGLRTAFHAADTEIVGVSADSIASHAKFRKKHDLSFPLASDPDKTMLEAYGIWVEKSMYGKKYMGIERSTFLIDRNGKIAAVWNKVKVPGHAGEVLSAVQKI
jgi:thioredoxin-dependent peroxiredoxin